MIRMILGILLMIAGVALGLYCGVWWAFIGGIIQVVEQIRAETIDAHLLAFGIARIVFAAAIGWLSGLILIFPGYGILKSLN